MYFFILFICKKHWLKSQNCYLQTVAFPQNGLMTAEFNLIAMNVIYHLNIKQFMAITLGYTGTSPV